MGTELPIELVPSGDRLALIGQVVVQWAYLEWRFDDCLAGFLLQHPVARNLSKRTIPISFNKRAKLWSDAAHICFGNVPTLEARFSGIAAEARRLRAERDWVAHAVWIAGYSRHIEKIRARLTRHGIAEEREIPVARLRETAAQISGLAMQLMRLTDAMLPDFLSPPHDLTREEVSALRAYQQSILQTSPNPGILQRNSRSFRK